MEKPKQAERHARLWEQNISKVLFARYSKIFKNVQCKSDFQAHLFSKSSESNEVGQYTLFGKIGRLIVCAELPVLFCVGIFLNYHLFFMGKEQQIKKEHQAVLGMITILQCFLHEGRKPFEI